MGLAVNIWVTKAERIASRAADPRDKIKSRNDARHGHLMGHS